MIKRESKFGQTFRHWLKSEPLRFSYGAAFELKQTSTALPFDAVEEHQLDALLAVAESDKGMLYKIPDDSRGIKPFDMVFMRKAPAYVVIKYPKHFEVITVGTFIHEKKISNRKSLTAQRAREISVVSVKTNS